MYYLIYLSAAITPPAESGLTDILLVSRQNNSKQNITGMLLYGDGRFIQLLEGEKESVQHTFEKISTDARHQSITLIASGETENRNFPEWYMGFRSINTDSVLQFEGYLNPAGENLLQGAENKLPVKLLKAFIRTSKIGIENITL